MGLRCRDIRGPTDKTDDVRRPDPWPVKSIGIGQYRKITNKIRLDAGCFSERCLFGVLYAVDEHKLRKPLVYRTRR